MNTQIVVLGAGRLFPVRLLAVFITLVVIAVGAAQASWEFNAAPVMMAERDPSPPTDSTRITMAVSGSLYSDVRKGEVRGVIAEVTALILHQMGYHPWPVTMTSSEIKKGLKNGEVAVAAGLLVGRPDKETVAYSDSIIREYNVVLTRAADGVSEISSLDDLQNKRIGARVGFVYPLLEERSGIELIRQRKDGENIRDLFLNELDFVVVGSVSDIYEFRSEGVMSDLQLLPAAVGYVDLGSAFSTATFSLEEIDEFRNRFNQMLGSPEWEAILFRNGIQDLVKEWPIVSQ